MAGSGPAASEPIIPVEAQPVAEKLLKSFEAQAKAAEQTQTRTATVDHWRNIGLK